MPDTISDEQLADLERTAHLWPHSFGAMIRELIHLRRVRAVLLAAEEKMSKEGWKWNNGMLESDALQMALKIIREGADHAKR